MANSTGELYRVLSCRPHGLVSSNLTRSVLPNNPVQYGTGLLGKRETKKDRTEIDTVAEFSSRTRLQSGSTSVRIRPVSSERQRLRSPAHSVSPSREESPSTPRTSLCSCERACQREAESGNRTPVPQRRASSQLD